MSTNIKPYITDEDIININDLVSELAVILRKFEIDLNPYQTDVYFYYDADAKIGRLETFINVGGHSWINDDHVTIYSICGYFPHEENKHTIQHSKPKRIHI